MSFDFLSNKLLVELGIVQQGSGSDGSACVIRTVLAYNLYPNTSMLDWNCQVYCYALFSVSLE